MVHCSWYLSRNRNSNLPVRCNWLIDFWFVGFSFSIRTWNIFINCSYICLYSVVTVKWLLEKCCFADFFLSDCWNVDWCGYYDEVEPMDNLLPVRGFVLFTRRLAGDNEVINANGFSPPTGFRWAFLVIWWMMNAARNPRRHSYSNEVDLAAPVGSVSW